MPLTGNSKFEAIVGCVPGRRSPLLHGFLGEAFQYNNFALKRKGPIRECCRPYAPYTPYAF
ncbi:MAG: hypothetical protein F6J93_14660 [Oscillatoria sp. SIO1A7]|nr:hypothetical protein [Oscillatoria sp. SIO1A7]